MVEQKEINKLVEEAFKKYDTDNSGYIEGKEIEKIYDYLYEKISNYMIPYKDYCNAEDKLLFDEDKKISLEEFSDAMSSIILKSSET